jgi:hypothetical protein
MSVIIDEACFKSWQTDKGGLTKVQVELLGRKWTDQYVGWQREYYGIEITDEAWLEIFQAKEIKGKPWPQPRPWQPKPAKKTYSYSYQYEYQDQSASYEDLDK